MKLTTLATLMIFIRSLCTFTLVETVDAVGDDATGGVAGSAGDDRYPLVPSVADYTPSQAPVSVPLSF